MVSETVLRRVARACLANAESLHKEAEFLGKHDFHARAAALAVIGGEEFAKSVAYTIAALLRPADDTIPALLKRLRFHEVKRLIQTRAEAAQIETAEAHTIAFQELGYKTSGEEWLVGLFVLLASLDLSSLITSRNEAQQFYLRLEGPMRGLACTPGPLDMKNAAFYVDLTDSGDILLPTRIDHDLSSLEVEGLMWFLEQFQGLGEVLADDLEWERFAAMVRRKAQPKDVAD